MKKLFIGILIGLALALAPTIIAEIQLSNPVTSSYQNIEIRGIHINPNGTVHAAFKRTDTGEAVLVNSKNADDSYSIKANVTFTAVSNVNTIVSQVETYIANQNLVQGSVVP